MDGHPTLLHYPVTMPWGPDTHQQILPLAPDAYRVVEGPGGWWVRDPDGGLIYFGAGPVRIDVSPAPF